MKKEYETAKGWALDANFTFHQETGKQCQRYLYDDPRTLSELCLEGAILLKEGMPRSKKERAEKPETWASKAKAKSLMVYK